MHFTCRSFIGHSQPGNWSQYWENEPDDRIIFSTHGHLFGLINLTSSIDNDVNLLGRDLINNINTSYYSNPSHDISSTINSILNQPEYQNISLSIVIAIVIGQQLNLVIFNSGEIIFKRDCQISRLLTGNNNELVYLSGIINPEDQLLLATTNFFQSLSWDTIKTFLSVDKVQDIEENFLAHLYSQDDQSSLAGVYIQMHDDIINSPSEYEEIATIQPSTLPPQEIKPKPTNIFTNFLLKNRPTFVSHQDNSINKKRQKINILISVFLIICLCGSSVYGYRQNSKKQTEIHYQQLKTELNQKIDNASALKNLNLNTALSQAQESQNILNKMITLKIHPDETSQYQQKISTLLSQTGSVENFSPSVFYDTSMIVDKPHFSQLILANNFLYLLDPTIGRLDQISLSQKSTKNISQAEGLKNSQYLDQSDGTFYILKDSEIFSVEKNDLVSKIKITDSVKDFTSGQFAFWNGSLYLLSFSDASIWKFTPNSTGFGAGKPWLKDGQRLPSNPTSMAINGDIWVIGQNGNLIPYTYGVKADFTFSSNPVITTGANLVTSLDSNLIAFSDNGSSIYVYKKDGQSMAHFNLGDRQITSLALDSTNNSIYVLCTDQKIYSFSL